MALVKVIPRDNPLKTLFPPENAKQPSIFDLVNVLVLGRTMTIESPTNNLVPEFSFLNIFYLDKG
ncbi:MAG: hypothetical protein SGJ04_00275 [Bacteroidota bacterium]|nr:hypothetical protein [Bacteroidota bacterium]